MPNETPPPLRGNFYSTSRTLRCFSYDSCRSCSLCRNYDPNSQLCELCESRKPQGDGHHCVCTPEHREIVARFEERFNRSYIPRVEDGPMDAQVPLDAENERLYEAMRRLR